MLAVMSADVIVSHTLMTIWLPACQPRGLVPSLDSKKDFKHG